MPTVNRFEDLRVWQTARQLVNSVYQLSQKGNFQKDFGLRDQIRRAAGSSMHNIAEGFEAGSDAQFIRFLGYARSSASETQSQLYTALDQEYIDQEEFQTLYELLTKLKMQINALIGYLNKSNSENQVKETNVEYHISVQDKNFADDIFSKSQNPDP